VSRTLYLQPQTRSLDEPYGSFSGDVKFISNGVDTRVALTIDVTASSEFRRGIGFLAIAAGVAASLPLIVGVRARTLRLQAEIPVEALQETVEKTIEASRTLPKVPDVDYAPVLKRLAAARRNFGVKPRCLLPPQVLPALPGTSADNSTKLKTLLESLVT
jgi:hypothetical protein